MTKNIYDLYQKQLRDKWHEERNSDIMVDQMFGQSSRRERFPVEENDRHEVDVHSKNDRNILTKLQETSTSADTMAPHADTASSTEYIDRIVDVPVAMRRQVPTIQTAQKQRQAV